VLKVDSVPRQALIAARERHTLVLSGPVMAEIAGVVRRPKFARAVTEETREGILAPLAVAAVWAGANHRLLGTPRTTSTLSWCSLQG
jgi:hypothetical protein